MSVAQLDFFYVWMSDPLRCLKDQLYAVLHPDVFWYHLNGMGAQKSTETQVSFPKCIKHQIFSDTQLQPLVFFGHH